MGSTIYTVKQGDTLSAIAKAHNTTVQAIQQANNDTIKDVNRIYTNQKINIPSTVSEVNKVDSINETFSNNPQADKQGCPTNQKIAIFPVRYAIDESPARRGGAPRHPIPSNWGSTGLPEIKTRNYCMRQLRDGWVYVWDGEKFDEYMLQGTYFTHTNRQEKVIPQLPSIPSFGEMFGTGAVGNYLSEMKAMVGEKGTEKYLEYESSKSLYIAYAQERWTERLYEKMLNNEKGQRTSWMRALDLTRLCQGIQPHTQLIEKVADYVADIYKDSVNPDDTFASTTVYYNESSDTELKVEVKPPLLSAEIVGAVPEKESAFFVALEDHMAVLSDLTLQQTGRNMELAVFDEQHQHKLYTASVVDQLCGANLTEEDYQLAGIGKEDIQKQVDFQKQLEECYGEVDYQIRDRKAQYLNPFHDRKMSQAEEDSLHAVWNHLTTVNLPRSTPTKTSAFKQQYPSITKEWFDKHYKAWDANSKSRRQVKYHEALEYLPNGQGRPPLLERMEESVAELIAYVDYVGNDPNRIFFDTSNKEQCVILTINCSTILEQITAFSEKGREWYQDTIETKQNLLALISYNFSYDFAMAFEKTTEYYLEHGRLEDQDGQFDSAQVASLMLAGGNVVNALPDAIGAVGEIYKTYFGNTGAAAGGTTGGTAGTSIPPVTTTGGINGGGIGGGVLTPPVNRLPVIAPQTVMQNRLATAFTVERYISSPQFLNLTEELQEIYHTMQYCLANSEGAWKAWQQSVFTRTINVNFAKVTNNSVCFVSLQIVHTVTLQHKTELNPITYTDPYYDQAVKYHEQEMKSLNAQKAQLINQRKGMASHLAQHRNTGKSYRIRFYRVNTEIASIDAKLQALIENPPQRVKVTGYMVNNSTSVAAEDIAIKLRYVIMEGFDLTGITQRQWLGLQGPKVYNQLRSAPPPARLSLPNPYANDIPEVSVKGMGLLGAILVGLNFYNSYRTFETMAYKEIFTAEDVMTLTYTHAYFASLLFSFRMGNLWNVVKGVTTTEMVATKAGNVLTTKKLMNMSRAQWLTKAGPNFERAAISFVRYAKSFAIFGFIASVTESINIGMGFGKTTSTGETVARSFKLFSTGLMVALAGFQLAALFGMSSCMTLAFGPWGVAATLVLAAIYFISSFYEAYYHIEGFDKWLYHSEWGNSPLWKTSDPNKLDAKRKEEQRSLQELLLQPTVYSIPQVDDYTGRIGSRQIQIVLPPQLMNKTIGLEVLFTEDKFPLAFWRDDKVLGSGERDMYGYAYQSTLEEGYSRSYTSFNQELNEAVSQLNNTDQAQQAEKPAEKPAVKEGAERAEEQPIVWETDFMYDDAPWIDAIHNAELVIHYPGDILSPRVDGKGYRFKISNLDFPVVSMGQLTYNNVDTTKPTRNELLIDTSNQKKSTTMTLLDPKEEV